MAFPSGLESALGEAAKLKEAQLRDKPSRQTWEQAPSFFKWTCGDYPVVAEARALGAFQDRLASAESMKEEGNQRFVEDQLDDALMRYSNAIAVFLWFQRKKDRSIEDVPLRNAINGLPVQEVSQAHQHLAACFLNAAAVLLKQKEYSQVIYACTKALFYQPGNPKAMYRRSQANYAMQTTYHLELAVKDLQTTAKLTPRDALVAQTLAKWKTELAEQTAKDRQTFGNMFSRGDLYSDAELCTKPSTSSSDTADGLGWIKPPFSEDARKQAADMGIDLEDPAVRTALAELHQKKVDGTEPADCGDDTAGASGNPQSYVDWWKALLSGRLRWRWHYLVYIFLWGHAALQTYKIVRQFSHIQPHPGDVATCVHDDQVQQSKNELLDGFVLNSDL